MTENRAENKAQPGNDTTPSSEELRRRVEATRQGLGETVEALAAKADVKARAQEKTTAVKHQVAEKTAHVGAQLRDKATHAAHAVQDRTPEPVRAKAAAAGGQVRGKAVHVAELARDKAPEPVREKAGQGMRVARANRAPLLAVGAIIALLMVRRSRRHR
ncbi:DUF3618 domain-containing protein [Streptomyces sp. NBC_00576]|uniref:DUF3618 domain-containing protein n=1 Tax=Streptomyces sp. NBC_00576 TaxID=2903665 RepID=UPI002E806B73|nr:DUF3618 domain-containing protein [Streptomyces sp. NBC_00576]WUB72982.1 DUF3618 domain-containing protein [Streptomyces sp. NBC_00576]